MTQGAQPTDGATPATTGRGKARKTRHAGDFYSTPPRATQLVASERGIVNHRRPRLDPSCGDGAILVELHRLGLPQHLLFGIELSAVRAEKARQRLPGATIITGSFFDDDVVRRFLEAVAVVCTTPDGDPDFDIIGNPPFGTDRPPLPSLADLFIRRCLEILPDHGDLDFLLKWGFPQAATRGTKKIHDLPFLDGVSRSKLFQQGLGLHLYPIMIDGRLDFRGDGGTDNTPHGWFNWTKGYDGPAPFLLAPLPGDDSQTSLFGASA